MAPDRIEMSVHLGIAAGTIDSILQRQLAMSRELVAQSVRTIERSAPRIDPLRQRLDDVMRRGLLAVERRQREVVQAVGGCVWRLRALDPFATLERGYAIVQRDSSVVTSVTAAHPGDGIRVRLSDGAFGAHVDGGAVQRPRLKRRVPDAQAPLFSMPEERA